MNNNVEYKEPVIIKRNKSLVIIQNYLGYYFLTKRKKLNHDSSMRSLSNSNRRTVRYKPIKKIPENKLEYYITLVENY